MGYGLEDETIQTASWPTPDPTMRGLADEHVAYVDHKHELIRLGRNLRADYEIGPGQKVDFALKPADEAAADALRRDAAMIGRLLKAAQLTIDTAFQPAGAMPSALGALGGIYLSLGSAGDAEKERAKIAKQVEQLDGALKGIAAKLDNANFLARAKPEVVEGERARQRELTEKREKLAKLMTALGS